MILTILLVITILIYPYLVYIISIMATPKKP